jgi:ATP-dependent Clp protease ATP-binding subunit ClpB
VDTIHLVLALVRQDGGVVPSVLEKIGVKAALFGDVLERQLKSRPQVEGEGLQRGDFARAATTLEPPPENWRRR